MNRPNLSILFATAEMVPFAKEGGLADVAGALPAALNRQGADVSVVMPLYGQIDRKKHAIVPAGEVQPATIPMGDRSAELLFFRTQLPDSRLTIYFADNETYFGREGVYNDPVTGEGFADNAERFIFFQKAVMHLIDTRERQPNLVHCNDFHTALIPWYLRRTDGYNAVATLFSIHNLAYQGIEPPAILDLAEIPTGRFYSMSPFEYFGQVNMMKIGILFADLVSTVSPTYAREIRTSNEQGFGLEDVLAEREGDLFGIVNGIDTDVWNPEHDQLIPHRFSKDDLRGKARNKKELQKQSSLPQKEVPLIGLVGRLVEQKGLDILLDALPELLNLDLQLVILGTGSRDYHQKLEELAARHPDRLAVHLTFDNRYAHLIEAGSDMFLMPSRFEPCGLNQLYSLAYGTIPIVRATGGLADTVRPYAGDPKKATGFAFREYSAKELLSAVRRALLLFGDPPQWKQLMLTAMQEDCSWQRSALKYINLYNLALMKR